MSIELDRFESWGLNLIVYAGKISGEEALVFYSSLDGWVGDSGPAWITCIDESADLSELGPQDFGALRRILLPRVHRLIQRDPGFCNIIVCNARRAEAILNHWREFIGRDRAEPYYPIFFSDLKGACEWLGVPPSGYEDVLSALDAARAGAGCAGPDPRGDAAPLPPAE